MTDDTLDTLLPRITGWRHALHAMPELGLEEVRTAAFVAARLREMGLEVTEGVGGTGVVGTLRGRAPGRSIGLRAELDALPMTETRPLPWASTVPGRMHACGHDGHMAMLLGAAAVLAGDGPPARGTVHFIFQPAEEGRGGAKAMLADGLFDRFPCDEIYATHNASRPVGQVAVHHGVLAASCDILHIRIAGRGGHAAMPHDAVNPLHAAARLLLALEGLPARITDARHPSVVTIGALNGGEAFNVIPDRVTMAGTVRCLDMTARARLEDAIRREAAAVAAAEGVTVQLDYDSAFSVTRNTPAEADHVIRVASALLGAGNVDIDPPPEMGSEDFCFLLEERPGCYFLLGQEDADHLPVCHDTQYDFNDRVLGIGTRLWVALVRDRLGA
jgi:amidohydrolase